MISGIISGFSEYWLCEIQRKQDKKKTPPDLYKIVELFRNDMRITNVNAKRGTHAFAATFQGKLIDDPKANVETDEKIKSGSKSGKFECVCGKKHPFRKCFYLVEFIRLKNWKPNAEKQKEIDKKIAANSKLQNAVKCAQKEAATAKETAKKNEKAAELASSPQASDDEATALKKLKSVGGFPAHVFIAITCSDYYL